MLVILHRIRFHANNNGPNTLPCGTPDDSAHVSNLSEPIATYCDRSETNDVSQRSATPVTPKSYSRRLHKMIVIVDSVKGGRNIKSQ